MIMDISKPLKFCWKQGQPVLFRLVQNLELIEKETNLRQK
jgi:hypothetical protein